MNLLKTFCDHFAHFEKVNIFCTKTNNCIKKKKSAPCSRRRSAPIRIVILRLSRRPDPSRTRRVQPYFLSRKTPQALPFYGGYHSRDGKDPSRAS